MENIENIDAVNISTKMNIMIGHIDIFEHLSQSKHIILIHILQLENLTN